MLTFNDDELEALESGTQRIGYLFRLATDPVVALWLGVGSLKPGVNAYDDPGIEYLGLGEVQDIPDLSQLINGRAERVEFSLSGVSGRVLEIASGGDAQQVKGKDVALGFVLFAQDWSQLGVVHWTANYVADFLGIDQAEQEDPEQSPVRMLRLSCGTMMTGRRRPSFSYFTDKDQQARFAGDKFCERTPVYGTGFNKTWPTFPDP